MAIGHLVTQMLQVHFIFIILLLYLFIYVRMALYLPKFDIDAWVYFLVNSFKFLFG